MSVNFNVILHELKPILSSSYKMEGEDDFAYLFLKSVAEGCLDEGIVLFPPCTKINNLLKDCYINKDKLSKEVQEFVDKLMRDVLFHPRLVDKMEIHCVGAMLLYRKTMLSNENRTYLLKNWQRLDVSESFFEEVKNVVNDIRNDFFKRLRTSKNPIDVLFEQYKECSFSVHCFQDNFGRLMDVLSHVTLDKNGYNVLMKKFGIGSLLALSGPSSFTLPLSLLGEKIKDRPHLFISKDKCLSDKTRKYLIQELQKRDDIDIDMYEYLFQHRTLIRLNDDIQQMFDMMLMLSSTPTFHRDIFQKIIENKNNHYEELELVM